ncbi:hypothetical protein GFL98_03405 [Rhizobium leguminosarum bv. viciae]|nr:hypothetical protein [Rhizobium leguminosarum bv. viciae]
MLHLTVAVDRDPMTRIRLTSLLPRSTLVGDPNRHCSKSRTLDHHARCEIKDDFIQVIECMGTIAGDVDFEDIDIRAPQLFQFFWRAAMGVFDFDKQPSTVWAYSDDIGD